MPLREATPHAGAADAADGMAALIRAHDWAATPLGPVADWPQSLKVAVRLLLNTRHPMFIWWGPELIQFYNDAYAESLGPEKHPSALGARGRDTWGEIWDVIGPQIEQVMRGGEATWHEDQLVPIVRHGAKRDVWWTYGFSPIDDAAAPHGVGGVLVICRETTAEVLARRDTDERYRALFEAVDSGFCITEVDLQGAGGRIDYRVVEANPAFHRHTGFPPDVLGRWLREAAPGLEEHWFETYGRVARTGVAERFEQGSDALGRWFDVYAFRVGDPEARRVAILFNDISERRRAELAVRELNATLERRVSEEVAERRKADALYRAYFENTAEALFIVRVEPDGGFAVEEINPAHAAATGLDPRAIRGRRLDREFAPEVVTPLIANYRRALAAGRPISYRESLAAPSGVRHFDTVLVPVPGENGAPARIVGSSRDVTARVAAEEALRQSQKMEAMGSLTGGVAHDFNNLLSPIIGGLDLLQRRGIGDERAARTIAGALQSAERAKTLVQRLLAFARRQPLQPAAVDLGTLARGMADLIGSTVGPQVRVAVAVEPDLPPALADANQVEMALLNLAVNARDAMPGGGRVSVAVAAELVGPAHRSGAAPGRYVRLSVADTGEGMDEATLRRAVEPFFSTKGVGRGTGLGLSMVHGLVAQLGGGFAIRSRPGDGTAVELWLPVADAAAAEREIAPAAGPDLAAGVALVVDDEELVRASTAEMLAELGFATVEAGSGDEAMALVAGGLAPDLLVTDHLMPGMTGAELARRLLAERPEARVLVVSGYAEVDGIASGLARLTKPFRQAELAGALGELGEGTG